MEPEDSSGTDEQDTAGLSTASSADASRALANRLADKYPVGEGEIALPEDTVGERSYARPVPEERWSRQPPILPVPASEPAPSATTVVAGEDAPEAQKRRRLWVALGLIGVLLLAALAGVGYLALDNKSRADRWQERSVILEGNVDELNGLLVVRSNTLNARTRELNRMATKVRKQQTALNSSEADVSSLEQRQRALAAEKADVEDSRAQLVVQAATLENVADAFVDCSDGLVKLLGYVLDEDYYSANAVIESVGSDCGYAESALSDYNSAYP